MTAKDGDYKAPPTQPAPRHDALALELTRKVAPGVAIEYEAARAEMLQLADCFGRAQVGNETEALHWARGVAANVCRVSRRWAHARAAVISCSGR